MKVAVYLSSHGYGHTIRTARLLDVLVRRVACKLAVVGSSPARLWPESLRAVTVSWRSAECDVGVVQPDDLTVDATATEAALESWAAAYGERVEAEARWLRSGFDLVLGDVPPLAFDAAALAGIPAVASANFSWDWIYERMSLQSAATAAASAYAKASLLLELEPCAPMPAFRERTSVGILGPCDHRPRDDVRRRLGVASAEHLVLVAIRASSAAVYRLPPERARVRYALAENAAYLTENRRDLLRVPADLTFVDVVAAADAVVAKPGYGIIADTTACGTPLLYTDRPGFPEHAVLVRWLETRPGTARVDSGSLGRGAWGDLLGELLDRGRPEPLVVEAAAAGAAEMARLLRG